MRDTPAVSNILARTGSIVKPSVPHGIHDVCLSCDLLVVGDDDDALSFLMGQRQENFHYVLPVFRIQITGGRWPLSVAHRRSYGPAAVFQCSLAGLHAGAVLLLFEPPPFPFCD